MKIYPQGLTFFKKTSSLAFSCCCFADDGTKMDKSKKRTCRACKAIVFADKICKFVTFSLPSPFSLLKFPNLSEPRQANLLKLATIVETLPRSETLFLNHNNVNFPFYISIYDTVAFLNVRDVQTPFPVTVKGTSL